MDSSLAAEQEGAFADNPVSDDEALARRISRGDVEAWNLFFERYASWAYRFACYHLGGNRADAEDVCSDILMTAAKCINQFNGKRGTLEVWLLGIARHRLAHFCRGRRIELPLVPEVTGLAANPQAPIADSLLETTVTREVVNRALASLPMRQAAVLIGKYVSGHSVEELARLSETTPKAIESLLARARSAFRAAFKALSQESSGGK